MRLFFMDRGKKFGLVSSLLAGAFGISCVATQPHYNPKQNRQQSKEQIEQQDRSGEDGQFLLGALGVLTGAPELGAIGGALMRDASNRANRIQIEQNVYVDDDRTVYQRNNHFYNGELIDGCHYTGELVNGVMNGSGTLTCPNSGVYVGTFVDGKRHGHGRFDMVSGNVYIGEFREGLLHGYGKIIRTDGKMLAGFFFNGEPKGEMTVTHIDGRLELVILKR